ncbi:hypothetical protein D1007_00098 [Hordeum vulgare]|nr:hypothetical protein D1007_00098 [Hordeum vulgare]
MSSSSSKQGEHNGAWLGSDICADHIDALRHRRMLPPASLVAVRIPGAETALKPQEGEVVVFDEHFYRGFGLPASTFFSNFLTFFSLQPHLLAPNANLQLALFVVLCEGFLGIEPHLDLWQSLFFFKQESIKMDKAEVDKLEGPRPMTPCGAALVHHRTKCGFPQMPVQESIKQCQRGFFYVKNVNPSHDAINMPPFAIEPPMVKKNWQAKYLKPIVKVAQIGVYLKSLKACGLLGRDLLTTMMTRRILPLHRRPHLICQISGRHDPCRLSTKNFHADAVAKNVNQISSANMNEGGDWEWGLVPYDRAHPPPMLFENLQGLNLPALDVETSDLPEEALELEGSEPSSQHLRPPLVDWTEDDEMSPSSYDGAFEEDAEEVEEVTSPPLTRGRRHAGETAVPGEAARNKGKSATTSKPAPKRAAPGPLAGGRAGGAKKRQVDASRKQDPQIVPGTEAEDVEEETASAAKRAGWAAADTTQKALEDESALRWDVAAKKMAAGQSQPSRAEKPKEKRKKARHDPSKRTRVDEPASEATPRRTQGTEAAKPPEPAISTPTDLEVIPDTSEAEVGYAPELNPEAPAVTMDAPEAADPPPATETAPIGTSMELSTNQPPGAGAIIELHDAQVHAYNMLRAQTQAVDGQVADLQGLLGAAVSERYALCDAGLRLQQQLNLLQSEKKDREASLQAELGQLRTTFDEKDTSYAADMGRLKMDHLEEMKLKDATLKEKEEALIQKQAQLAKAMDTAATLQEELSRAAQASTVREREALEEAHETGIHFNCKPFFHFVLNFFFFVALPSYSSSHPFPCPRNLPSVTGSG